MPISPNLIKCYKYIDDNSKNYVKELEEIVKIPNVSSDPAASKNLSKMIDWMSNKLKSLGFQIIMKEPDYNEYKANLLT